jgi:hypothetical protein
MLYKELVVTRFKNIWSFNDLGVMTVSNNDQSHNMSRVRRLAVER